MNNIISNRTRVTVGGQVYDIPSDKVSELLNQLARWQSISISETNNSTPNWEGKKLLFG